MVHEKADYSSLTLQKDITKWITQHTKVLEFGPDTLEIETILKDSFGETVYCFVEKNQNGSFDINDDGRALFKLDPCASDAELIDAAADLVFNAGFSFNADNGVISCESDPEDLVKNIMQLAQIEVNVSYLN